ncbi:MAG: hypothetical protein LBB50_01525 [Oscillospiraceae bacterium]|jgi:shikimate dehydrogenase|nr:hypothetical protein [Oscillospiraceae bacterium]
MEYALIGEHLTHSWSPEIHRQLRGYDYRLCPLCPTALPTFFASRKFRGINVTIPYKQAVLPFCDALGAAARRTGAVNTIVKRGDGTLFGDNTDLAGLQAMLRMADISLAGKRVLIFGNGGASLAAQLAAQDANAAAVFVASRGGKLNFETIYTACADAQVILNATPVGMFPHSGETLADLARFLQLEAVADLIYNPLRTRLLQQAARLGCKTANGLAMLVAQAAAAAEVFTGMAQPVEDTLRVTENLRRSTENWVLIGMPGCGKSTVGRLLAERAERPFVDVDDEIARRAGLPCAEMIRRRGEEAFRQLESETIATLGARTGLVIATGGGAVLREENVQNLRQNGKLLWIRRATEALATVGRPLSQNLEVLVQARQPYYEAAADATLAHEEDWNALVEKAHKIFAR